MRARAARSAQLLSVELSHWARGSASAAAPAAVAGAKPVLEKEFLIYRWNPDTGEAPTYQSYKVDVNK